MYNKNDIKGNGLRCGIFLLYLIRYGFLVSSCVKNWYILNMWIKIYINLWIKCVR